MSTDPKPSVPTDPADEFANATADKHAALEADIRAIDRELAQTHPPPPPPGKTRAPRVKKKLETRYTSLRTIASLFRFASMLPLIVAGVGFAELLGGFSLPALGLLAAGAIGTLLVVAFAESIDVLLDIEENTRRTALAAEAGAGKAG